MLLPRSHPLALAPSPQILPRDADEELLLGTFIPIEVQGLTACSNVAGPSLDTERTRGGMLISNKVPGTRCPTCALEGKEVWVIPGRNCGYCGTPCDQEAFGQ